MLPPGATDSHCHVFGPRDRFPFAPDRAFTPDDVPKEQLMALHERLGLERAVVVQSACHGTDHAALLDALEAAAGRYRGVALITPDFPEEELERLTAAGVCGFRVGYLPHLGVGPEPEAVRTMVERTAPRGWHAEVHVAGAGIREQQQLIRSLGVPVVIDHLARIDPADEDGLRALLGLLDTGDVWLKVSGADRVSAPPYAEGVALARRCVEHAPERIVWGTDFPHPNHDDPVPDDDALLGLLPAIAGEHLERLMRDNPATLFGFR